MTYENLKDYKQKIANLSYKEKIARDTYLRGLATGEIQGPPVGYPSVDVPALAYYKFDEYIKSQPKETITEALFRNNIHHLKDTAIEYFGTSISYFELYKNIYALVDALDVNGVKKGDGIIATLPGIPEAMYSLYAAGYLGATCVFMLPYLKKESMIADINKDHSRILIIMDVLYEQYKEVYDEVLEKSTLERIIVVPTLNSSKLGKIKKSKKFPGTTSYNDFVKEGEGNITPYICPYEENMPVAVVYSSGTTGDIKGVLLSHDSINNSALSYLPFGFDLKRGQKFYQTIPVWTSTGLVANGTSPLYYGSILHQDPRFDPLTFSKNIGKSKSNWGIGTTELFNGLDEISKKKLFSLLTKLHILDYTKLNNAYVGGTLSTPNDKAKLNELFKRIGSPAVANSSYGTCENGSIVTAELNDLPHYDYSVGIPIPGATVIAIDKDEHELPYNTRGELAVSTNCGMLRYYNRPDLKDVFYTDETDGARYKHTGDIGYVRSDGFVIYEGRANDISIVDGTQIYNFDVKQVIIKDPDVFDCEVFMHDEKLCAHLVFKHPVEDIDLKFVQIQTEIMHVLKDDVYVPELFKVRTSFPMAASTKRDYKALKEEQDGYVYIPKNRYARERKCDIL